MKHFFWIMLLLPLLTFSQAEDAWVFFTDKPQANTYLSNPLTMLSQRALDRRNRLNISLDNNDVPVDNNYISQITNANGINVLAKSKWLNAVHVQGSQTNIQNLLSLSFVDKIEFANKNIGIIQRPQVYEPVVEPIVNRRTVFDYGFGDNQINMLHGEVMHQHNYTGDGVLLAVIDAGFTEVDTAPIFQHLHQNNKILDVYNFVSGNQDIYQFSYHGTGVLSTIAAKTNGELVGTAPDVSVILYVSEDVSQEMPIEESYWAEAAERADSLGVDVINTSLGYRTFDRPEYNYTMADLNGQTAFISRAADIAVSRGINVVVSAGNSGQETWNKIGMPGDAVNVITVGAVDDTGIKTGFSSIGPTADGRIKPEVMAQGSGVAAYYGNGFISFVNGTSFSSPIIAGMVACMVQAFPNKTPAQIKQDLISISDRFNNPNNEYGYGIPDFSQYNLANLTDENINTFIVYPNPTHDIIYVKNYTQPNYQIYTIEGKIVKQGSIKHNQINISNLTNGVYYINIENITKKLIIE